MRQRKVVVLIDGNEERHSITRFMLRTYCYGVISIWRETPEALAGVTPDCVLGFWPLDSSMADAIARFYAVPFILAMPDPETPLAGVFCTRALVGGDCLPASILDAVKIACAHKRGPKPAIVINASHEAALLLGVA